MISLHFLTHTSFSNKTPELDWMFSKVYENEIDLSELIVEIDRFKRLVRSSGTTFERSATAIDVSSWLTNCRLPGM